MNEFPKPIARLRIEEPPETPGSLTRRQWLLRLGEAAVLAGFSGIADGRGAAGGPDECAGSHALAADAAAGSPAQASFRPASTMRPPII